MKSREADFLGAALKAEDVMVINLPPNVRRRTRVSKGGKVSRRYMLEIETEPVFHFFDAKAIGRGAAEVIAEKAGQNLRRHRRMVSKTTQKLRQWAERVYWSGQPASAKRWVDRRYSGGRIGETPPDGQSTAYGVDSGRLADGLSARYSGKGENARWTINVPANRLNQDTWRGDDASFQQWMQAFSKAVDLSGIVASGEFKQAANVGIMQAIVLMTALETALMRKRRQLWSSRWKVVKGGARILATF
jgi:hypothetical protein